MSRRYTLAGGTGFCGRIGLVKGSGKACVQALEGRVLLAVTAGEYDTIRSTYPGFNLPADMAQINIIEIAPGQLSVASLKNAITTAGSTALPDLVVLRTTDTQNAITYASSGDAVSIDIPSTMGAISVVGFGSRPLTIDAANQSRVISVGSYHSTTIVNLGGMTLTQGGNSVVDGGGIYQYYGTLSLANVTISGSAASYGGGMFQSDGALALTNVTLSGNTTSYGGGLYQSGGTSTLTNVTISGNTASHGGGLNLNFGTSTLTNVTITGNTASHGGGLSLNSGTATMTDVTISGNTAHGTGGGLTQSDSTSTLTNVAITGNTASHAGGMSQTSGTSTLTNVTISGNTVDGSGGGMSQTYGTSTLTNVVISGNTAVFTSAMNQYHATATLTNVTIAGNTAQYLGAVLLDSGSLALWNSIVARNTAGDGNPNLYLGTGISGSNNLIGDGTGQTSLVDGTNGNLVGTSTSPIDPQFVNMAGTDWTKWDLRLQPTSPAVNAGNNAWIPPGVTTDITGGARIIGGTVDMGAYELNQAPNNILLSSSSIAEGRPSGSVVGTFSTTDPDIGDSFTYSLVSGTGSADNGSFTISGSSLRTAASFDFETKSSYSIRVRTTDQGGLIFEKAFTISVTDVNEAPVDIILPRIAMIAENQPVGTMVCTLGTADPDAGDTFTYSLVSGNGSADNGSFTIIGSDLLTAAIFDFETNAGYSIRIRTTDQGGLWFEKAVTISVTDVNEAPADISLSSTGIAENPPVNTAVGTLSTIDPDSGNTFTYSLVSGAGSGDNGLFRIVGDQLLTASSSGYETDASYLIRIRTTDQGGLWLERIFTIVVTNQRPTEMALVGTAVAENRAVGTMVGTLWSTDFNSGNTFTYSLVSGPGSMDNGLFAINGNELQTAASFDYESKSSYSVRIRTTDQGGLWFEKAFAIAVTDVNEAPTDLGLSRSRIAENLPAGTGAGFFSSTDPDLGNTFSYALVGGTGDTDNELFTISSNKLQTVASLNYETQSSCSIRVRTTDQGGLFFEKVFAITVTDVNETPTDASLSNASVAENQPGGTVVGTLSSTDPDSGEAFVYSMVAGSGSGDNGSFGISGNQLLSASSFDHEAKDNYSIRIRTADAAGLYFEKVFVISVSDVNEVPTDVTLSSTAVQENQAAGMVVGALSSADPDSGETFTYALVDGVGSEDNGSFVITDGQLVTAERFNYEAKSSDSIRVRATDAGGLSIEKPFTITVTDDAGDSRRAFGLVNGKTVAASGLQDTDGDQVTFQLTGGGTGNVYGSDKSFEDIILTGTGPKSVLTVKVKKGKTGDGLVTIGNLSSDGLIRSINASGAILSGLVQLNTLGQAADKAMVAMELRQLNGADIQVQGVPVSSIAVSGDVSGSRIVTTGSIGKFSAATLLDSDILVGVATTFAGHFASGWGDFANAAAKLGSLRINGQKLPKGNSHPAYVAGSHISAPSVGTVTLLNVPKDSGPVVHVLNDVGVLKVSESELVNEAMFTSGTWKTAGVRPGIWEVV